MVKNVVLACGLGYTVPGVTVTSFSVQNEKAQRRNCDRINEELKALVIYLFDFHSSIE